MAPLVGVTSVASMPMQRRLSRAVRAEQAEDVAAPDGERDVRHGAAPAEVTRDVGQLDAIEIEVGGHARRRPARSAGSGLVSSLSSAP